MVTVTGANTIDNIINNIVIFAGLTQQEYIPDSVYAAHFPCDVVVSIRAIAADV